MKLTEPFKVYTAASNNEAQLIVIMLEASDIAAFVEEDHSGVSLWSFGTISQFHQPNVWVEKAAAMPAAELIRDFELQNNQRRNPEKSGGTIQVLCEECGKKSSFPKSLDGTTQDCPHCRAYLDVGKLDWGVDFGSPEE